METIPISNLILLKNNKNMNPTKNIKVYRIKLLYKKFTNKNIKVNKDEKM